mgnify:CR=1 FL=1
MSLRIAIYGKGGIGKSVVATSLSAAFAGKGMGVLHIGCDPKSDSAVRLMPGSQKVPTVLQVLGDDASAVSTENIIHQGRLGIHCCEAGGPPPGLGCGGRGVARTLEFLEDMEVIESGNYGAVVFDVLGDVVCGGFAAPLRQGFAEKVFIVLSEEPMSVYAANNISRAVEIYQSNGVALGGLVVNTRDNAHAELPMLEAFAARLSTRILGRIPRDPKIMEAERKRMTVVEYAPEAPAAQAFRELADTILSLDSRDLPTPTPLDDEAFYAFMEQW